MLNCNATSNQDLMIKEALYQSHYWLHQLDREREKEVLWSVVNKIQAGAYACFYAEAITFFLPPLEADRSADGQCKNGRWMGSGGVA